MIMVVRLLLVCEGYKVPRDKYLTKTTILGLLFVCEGYKVPRDKYLTKTTILGLLTLLFKIYYY
jgi:hypothetical protein